MSDIRFKCPTCESNLEVDEAGAGLIVDCPQCGSSIQVPAKASNEPRASAATQDEPISIPQPDIYNNRRSASGAGQMFSALFKGQELLFSTRHCAGLLPGCIIASLTRDPQTLETVMGQSWVGKG
jgi:DNA-directed RNA polymerase subunit RPC12/RpoP